MTISGPRRKSLRGSGRGRRSRAEGRQVAGAVGKPCRLGIAAVRLEESRFNKYDLTAIEGGENDQIHLGSEDAIDALCSKSHRMLQAATFELRC